VNLKPQLDKTAPRDEVREETALYVPFRLFQLTSRPSYTSSPLTAFLLRFSSGPTFTSYSYNSSACHHQANSA